MIDDSVTCFYLSMKYLQFYFESATKEDNCVKIERYKQSKIETQILRRR